MSSQILSNLKNPILEFCVFLPNKVGQLNELLNTMAKRDIHVLAMNSIDLTRSNLMRMIVNYPVELSNLLDQVGLGWNQSYVLGIELEGVEQLPNVTRLLVQAEVNIFYVYSFLMRHGSNPRLALSVDDNEIAEKILTHNHIRILNQSDLGR